MRALARAALALCALSIAACAGRSEAPSAPSLAELRREGPKTDDPDCAASWLLSELLSSGGTAEGAKRARAKLEDVGTAGMSAWLAVGLDESLHGKPGEAASAFLEAVRAARTSQDARARMVAWYAASQATALRESAPDLWDRYRPLVETILREPGAVGWRTRAELTSWWADEAWQAATEAVEDRAAEQYGCAHDLRIAGPFGHGASADAVRSFAAERPGAWPARFDPEPDAEEAPRVLRVERTGCSFGADEPVGEGIFYAETFVDLDQERELLLAAQGALALWVNDERVLERDPRVWGVWPRFGVVVRLPPGRHRIVAKLPSPSTTIRILEPDGRPSSVLASANAGPGYSTVPPVVTRDPNEVSRFVAKGDIVDPGDDVGRFLAAELSHVEGQDDIAALMLEPLVKDVAHATGPALLTAAKYAAADPLYDPSQGRDLVRELQSRAVDKDKNLWAARVLLAVWEAQSKGGVEAVPLLRGITADFPAVAEPLEALSHLYAELGWSVERGEVVRELVRRFPHRPEALRAGIELAEERGDAKTADALLADLKRRSPDDETEVSRSIERRQYLAALGEIERLRKRRPTRDDLKSQAADVQVRQGDPSGLEAWLDGAVRRSPRDADLRLWLADLRFAHGDRTALWRSVAEATEAGADPASLESALLAVEGATELERWRVDGRAVIAEYEKGGRHLEGNAARVLDYAALWVRSDGSSQMLEHEIVRVQSAEGIAQFAEQRKLEGRVLAQRVLKKDGGVLEPEMVSGKPTVTFPHLEIGDYIETEHVMPTPGVGRGSRYVGPRWFFREENVAYWRSEFVVISPKARNLVVETTGVVPAPEVSEASGLVSRRWRVEGSPPAPSEPFSPPISEFLPSVRIAWGIHLDARLRSFADSVAQVTPVDPRIRRIARRIVEPHPVGHTADRAKSLYNWVLDNVEPGDETDGRRVIVGKHGSRWQAFVTLCRALDIQTRFALAKNVLAAPPQGVLSEADAFAQPVVRVDAERGPVWAILGTKFAPFGYLPATVRGMPAFVVGDGKPELGQLPRDAGDDRLDHSGTIRLRADGSASVEIALTFEGLPAAKVRGVLSRLPERQVRDLLESKILAPALAGARLDRHEVVGGDGTDGPVILRLWATAPGLAHREGRTLVLAPPFSPHIGQIALLETRETPLLVSEATEHRIRMRVELPKGATSPKPLRLDIADGSRTARILDSVENGVLVLDRTVVVPAGRIEPNAYPRFVRFSREADAALATEYRITVAP